MEEELEARKAALCFLDYGKDSFFYETFSAELLLL
jgi:hypothetical protein